MAEIKSTLGSSSVNATEPRHFTVTDESEGVSSFQGHLMQNQHPQHSARGPIIFNSTESVAPPTSQLPPQYNNQPQNAHNYQQPVSHGSYEEAMAYRQQYMAQKKVEEQQNLKNERASIEVLIGIGRKFKDVHIQSENGNTVFRISTLKSKERQHVAQAMDALMSRKNNEELHKLKDIVLSYCIFSIEGRSLDSILGCSNIEEADRFYIRESFVKELDDNVSSYLFSHFEQLDKESREKYSLSSSEDIKGVADAISKSG